MSVDTFRKVIEEARADRHEANLRERAAVLALRFGRRSEAFERLTPAERCLVEDLATDNTFGDARFSLDWGSVHITCCTPEVKNALRSALRKLAGYGDRGE